MTTIKNDFLYAQIDEMGSQLCSLRSDDAEYIFNNMEIWPKHAPVLFPFAGRLFEQKFIYEGKEFGPVEVHGFAPYAKYDAARESENSVTMKMQISEEIRKIWPFDFEFSVNFRLEKHTLFITYTVKNKGGKKMYYGMGSHPGFNVPITPGLKFEDYYVEFPEAGDIMQCVMSPSCLYTGQEEPFKECSGTRVSLKHSLFDNDAVILSGTGSRAVIKTDKDAKSIIIDYPDTQYVALWHKPKIEVPFLCVEPWTSLPGSADAVTELEKKPDYNILEPGCERSHHLNITVD